MGKLEGEVDLAGELVVAPPAVLNGDIRAVVLAVSGSVTGTLAAREKIDLEKSAAVGLHILRNFLCSLPDGVP